MIKDRNCSYLIYIVNLSKIMELKNLTQENVKLTQM